MINRADLLGVASHRPLSTVGCGHCARVAGDGVVSRRSSVSGGERQ